MEDHVMQVYPLPSTERPLEGLYLGHDIRQYLTEAGPYVYTNFVVSLDGRIAVADPSTSRLSVPRAIANERDWRLFQELLAQADIVITSGDYLRRRAEGRAQEILQVNDPRYADLRDWRAQHGLPPFPDIAIVSRSLAFAVPEVLTAGGRKVWVYTITGANPARVREIEASSAKVVVAGEEGVLGKWMVGQMVEQGYQAVYSIAGPGIHQILLEARLMDRLYMTLANRVLSGETYALLTEGTLLQPPVDMRLNAIYYDPHAPEGLGQLFLSYDAVNTPGSTPP
jgi:riboflavin biosynthesis pyrimidine reductase